MFHRIWPISVALAVLPVGASAASASALSGVAVATGTVTSSTGMPMPDVAVDLYAWPSDAVLSAMKPGGLVPTTLLTTATTSSTGQYTLTVPATSLKTAAIESGYANLEIYSPYGGIWFFSYQTGALPGRPSAPVTVDLGGKKSKPVCGLDGAQPYGFSGFALLHHRKPAEAVVGQGYIDPGKKTAGDSVTFDYTKGMSHSRATSLGVGLSGYGADAGYKGTGTHESTAARSEGFPAETENTWFRTEFKTGQFRGICYGHTGVKVPRVKQHSPCPAAYEESYVHKCLWLIKSIGWFGGSTVQHPKIIPYTPSGHCAPHVKGSHFSGDYGKAVKWDSGFELAASLDIKTVNLKSDFNSSAQTGYDTNAVMYYHFKQSGFLCGTNAPEATAAILVARASRS
jgi:hypothetical protein